MSSLQSGAYQSKILSNAVRQTRHWLEQGQTALRRLKTAATWGAQVLLYPAYVAFQTVRLAAAQVRQGLELGLPTFRQALRSRPPIAPVAPIVPTVDTPIQQALETIQEFTLPTKLPVALPLPSDRPQSIVRSSVNRAISALRNLWTRSIRLESIGTSASPESVKTNALPLPTVGIRGVATLLATRSLVLVTHQNEILDILTPAQQTQLRDRIIGAVADYRRYLKTQSRPLLASSRGLVRVVRPLWAGARSQFRFLAALLYALAHTVRQMVAPPAGSQLAAADLPIQQALRLVQQFSLPAVPNYIRGLACQRDTRSLVLVTDQNQIVDHLSAAQQAILRRRMVWDIAHYGRDRHRQQRPAFARLQTDDRPHLLPPVRGLRWLMAWMQTSPVAIAANLFREASLVLAPTIAPPAFQPVQPVPFPSVPAWQGAIAATGAAPSEPHWTPLSSTGAVEPFRQGSATHSPDYIETPATLLGYVQTPIEAVLRWLDHALLWLERAIVQMWRWVQQLL